MVPSSKKRSKAIDMQFYWLKDRVSQGQFRVFWEPGGHNLGDYYTKFHSGTHHRNVRPIYQYNKATSPTTIKGCIEILNYKQAKQMTRTTKTTQSASAAYRVTWKDQETPTGIITRKRQSMERRAPTSILVRNQNQNQIARAH